MPSPSERAGRHRKPGPEKSTKSRRVGRVILWNTIFALALGAIFVGGYLMVWYLIADEKPTLLQTVPGSVDDFTPVNPSVPLTSVNIDKECSDFFDQDDAQKYYIAQGGPTSDPDQLDLDNDGLACENYNYNSSPDTSKVNTK